MFENKDVELFCGDSALELRNIPDDFVDLVVTSPPYDNLREYEGNSAFDFAGIARQLTRVIKPGGVIVWVVGDASVDNSETGTSFKQALYFMEKCKLNLHDTMIYLKAGTMAFDSNRYTQSFEYMFVFSKGAPKTFNRISDRKNKKAGKIIDGQQRGADGSLEQMDNYGKVKIKEYGGRFNAWLIPNAERGIDHPAPFPYALARDHIISWTHAGNVVLDCFMGSGTTGAASVNLKRKFIGIEINQSYFDLAKKRISMQNPSIVV